MTVKELIAELRKHPGNAAVMVTKKQDDSPFHYLTSVAPLDYRQARQGEIVRIEGYKSYAPETTNAVLIDVEEQEASIRFVLPYLKDETEEHMIRRGCRRADDKTLTEYRERLLDFLDTHPAIREAAERFNQAGTNAPIYQDSWDYGGIVFMNIGYKGDSGVRLHGREGKLFLNASQFDGDVGTDEEVSEDSGKLFEQFNRWLGISAHDWAEAEATKAPASLMKSFVASDHASDEDIPF